MLLNSPNFDVKLIIFFPILARGLFPKLLEKALHTDRLGSVFLRVVHKYHIAGFSLYNNFKIPCDCPFPVLRVPRYS